MGTFLLFAGTVLGLHCFLGIGLFVDMIGFDGVGGWVVFFHLFPLSVLIPLVLA